MIQKIFRMRFADSRNETIWLTVYADLVTNLALVFLALFGLTMMGDEATRQALLSMKLGEISFLKTKPMTDFQKMSEGLKVKLEGYSDITFTDEVGSARIQFGENILFNSGEARIKEEAWVVLEPVAKMLNEMPYSIIVEGHTDSVPLKPGGRFKDNWELSLARAMSVVRLLIKKGQLSPEQLGAAAYGSQRPRATNLTGSGRRVNRRVEIALFKDFPFSKTPLVSKEPDNG